jgi:carbonic anhydrase
MDDLKQLFENNRRWVANMTRAYPGFFENLAQQQAPRYLWIGCADSRVPANEIVGLLPGELFVHRNVSNVVALDDPNCLTVIQYAVDVLKVEHIIVCGHFGCGGVQATLEDRRLGLSDLWLTHVRDVKDKHHDRLEGLDGPNRFDRLCQLNVIEQVLNVSRTTIVRDAWTRQQNLSLHGWIYAVSNGLLRDLGISIARPEDALQQYNHSLQNLKAE